MQTKTRETEKKFKRLIRVFLSVKIILVQTALLLLLNFLAWKTKELSEEVIKTPTTSGNNFVLKLKFIHNTKIGAKLDGNCLKQDIFSYGNVVNLFIVYELGT